MQSKKEINKRDVLISRLLAQSNQLNYLLAEIINFFYFILDKEYISDKERQEIELQAQRLTLQEQRNHIEILDTALMNAQNTIITLENDVCTYLSNYCLDLIAFYETCRYGRNMNLRKRLYFSKRLYLICN